MKLTLNRDDNLFGFHQGFLTSPLLFFIKFTYFYYYYILPRCNLTTTFFYPLIHQMSKNIQPNLLKWFEKGHFSPQRLPKSARWFRDFLKGSIKKQFMTLLNCLMFELNGNKQGEQREARFTDLETSTIMWFLKIHAKTDWYIAVKSKWSLADFLRKKRESNEWYERDDRDLTEYEKLKKWSILSKRIVVMIEKFLDSKTAEKTKKLLKVYKEKLYKNYPGQNNVSTNKRKYNGDQEAPKSSAKTESEIT